MTAEQIIYDKLRYVWMNENVTITDLSRLAHNAVTEIRNEFINAGVNVWPTEGRGVKHESRAAPF